MNLKTIYYNCGPVIILVGPLINAIDANIVKYQKILSVLEFSKKCIDKKRVAAKIRHIGVINIFVLV